MKKSKDVANMLGVVRSTLFGYCKECHIKGTTIENRVYYSESELLLLQEIHKLRQQKKTWYEIKTILNIEDKKENDTENSFQTSVEDEENQEDIKKVNSEMVYFRSELIETVKETTQRFFQLSEITFNLGKAQGQIDELLKNQSKTNEIIENKDLELSEKNKLIDELKTQLNNFKNNLELFKKQIENDKTIFQHELDKKDLTINSLKDKIQIQELTLIDKDKEIDKLKSEFEVLKNKSLIKKIFG